MRAHHHHHIVSICLALILVVGMGMYTYMAHKERLNLTSPHSSQIITSVEYSDEIEIYQSFTHTGTRLWAEIPVSSPCDLLDWNVQLDEVVKTVHIDFSTRRYGSVCEDITSTQTFLFDVPFQIVSVPTATFNDVSKNILIVTNE